MSLFCELFLIAFLSVRVIEISALIKYYIVPPLLFPQKYYKTINEEKEGDDETAITVE